MTTTVKGFTLIELLIVIGILAILATTVVLVLNPAQILQETRDTQRISDLSSVQSAIGLYLATASSIDMDFTAVGTCGTNWWSSISATPLASQPFANPAVAINSQTITAANIRAVNGNGWVPMNLGLVSGGSPLAGLPQDPSSTGTGANGVLTGTGHFYAYQCANVGQTLGLTVGPAYEINANMESGKFSGGTTPGSSDVEGTDGGTVNTIYEVGNAPGLAL